MSAILHWCGDVTVNNVASYRAAANVEIEVPGYGKVKGDVAWGGNWFYLVRDHNMELTLNNIEALTNFTWAIRQALCSNGITGAGGREIDHVELFGPPKLRMPTARISCSVPARPMIVLLAAPGPARSSLVSMPTEKFAKVKSGDRKALSEACSKARSKCGMARSIRASRDPHS